MRTSGSAGAVGLQPTERAAPTRPRRRFLLTQPLVVALTLLYFRPLCEATCAAPSLSAAPEGAARALDGLAAWLHLPLQLAKANLPPAAAPLCRHDCVAVAAWATIMLQLVVPAAALNELEATLRLEYAVQQSRSQPPAALPEQSQGWLTAAAEMLLAGTVLWQAVQLAVQVWLQ